MCAAGNRLEWRDAPPFSVQLGPTFNATSLVALAAWLLRLSDVYEFAALGSLVAASMAIGYLFERLVVGVIVFVCLLVGLVIFCLPAVQ